MKKIAHLAVAVVLLALSGCLASAPPLTEEDHRYAPRDWACAEAHAQWTVCHGKCSDTFFLFRPSCLSCDNRLAMVCSRGSGLGN